MPAEAAVVAVSARGWRIVARQVVESRGHPRGVEIVPERNPLAPEDGLRRLVVEGPEVELQPVVADVPEALARQGLRAPEKTARTARADGGG